MDYSDWELCCSESEKGGQKLLSFKSGRTLAKKPAQVVSENENYLISEATNDSVIVDQNVLLHTSSRKLEHKEKSLFQGRFTEEYASDIVLKSDSSDSMFARTKGKSGGLSNNDSPPPSPSNSIITSETPTLDNPPSPTSSGTPPITTTSPRTDNKSSVPIGLIKKPTNKNFQNNNNTNARTLAQSAPNNATLSPKSGSLSAASPKRPNLSSPVLPNVPVQRNTLAEFSASRAHIAKELFFLEKKRSVSSLGQSIKVREDKERILNQLDSQYLTVYSRALESPEMQTGFSLFSVLKETSILNSAEDLLDYYYFYFANEIEREKFEYLNTSNSVRAHWIVHDPNINLITSTRSTILPYTIITYTVIGETMLFLETSSTPTLKNSFIELPVSSFLLGEKSDLRITLSASKRGKPTENKKILDSNKIKQYITDTWGHSPVTIPDTKEVIDALVKIEKHKKTVLRNISCGFLYRKSGQYTREEITTNRNPPKKFYDFLKCCGCSGLDKIDIDKEFNVKKEEDDDEFSSSTSHDLLVSFKRNIAVTWYLAPLLDEDGVRQKIGNSMFIILYNDSDEPFDPSQLYLGKLSVLVCVVRPVTSEIVSSSKQFQLSFYFCYDSNIVLDDASEVMQQMNFFNNEPQLPPNYIFTSSNVFDFILAKFTNCLSQILNYHPSFGSQYYTPIAHLVENIVVNNASSFHKGNLEAFKKRKK